MDRFEQARKYLRNIPPAVSGNGGHDQFYKALAWVRRCFGVDERDLGILAREYSEHCDPPWNEKEINHKVEDVMKNVAVEVKRSRGSNYYPKRTPHNSHPQNGSNKKLWKSLDEAKQEYSKLPLARENETASRLLQDDYEIPPAQIPGDWRILSYKGKPGIVYVGCNPQGKPCSYKWKSIQRNSKGKREPVFLAGSGGAMLFHSPDPDIPLVVVSGEEKALAAKYAGFNVLSPLTGEHCLNHEWIQYLLGKSKQVILANDNDKCGSQANLQTAAHLHKSGLDQSKIHIVKWRADHAQGTDLNDILKTSGKEDLHDFLLNAPEWNPLENPINVFRLTDIGNAERVKQKYKDKLHYCEKWGQFLLWNGKFWEPDSNRNVELYAKETIRNIPVEAKNDTDPERYKDILKHAMRCESDIRIKALISRLKPEVAACPETFDPQDTNYLLNVGNGIIDLKTGKLLKHDPKQKITRFCDIIYNPEACCEEWDKFLFKVMEENLPLIGYLQRAIGYSMIGAILDRVIFILWGTGKNGKSVFLETIKLLLGTYAAVTNPQAFMERKDNATNNDIARLKGVRFVSASESDTGSRLSLSFIKRITGGDTMTARFLYGEWFEFRPQFKVWMATNQKPAIPEGGDQAFWDRIHLIPFKVRISDDEVIPFDTLMNILRDELPGILTWAVKGCLEYQKIGLAPPPEVQNAIEEYRDEQDPIQEFVTEECKIDPKLEISKTALYNAYNDWAERQNIKPLSKKAFGRCVINHGIQDRKSTGGTRKWIGIGLHGE